MTSALVPLLAGGEASRAAYVLLLARQARVDARADAGKELLHR